MRRRVGDRTQLVIIGGALVVDAARSPQATRTPAARSVPDAWGTAPAADWSDMETSPVVPRAPLAPVPPRPTLPVPPTVTAFAGSLDRAFAATGSLTPTSSPARPSDATTAAATDGARTAGAARSSPWLTLGAMLRAGGAVVPPAGDVAPVPAAPGVEDVAKTTGPSASGHAASTTGVGAPPPPDVGAATGRGALAGRVVVTPVDGRETSSFGPRRHPIHGGVRDHHGLDLAAPTGTRVVAVTDGRVVAAGDRGGYGLVVEVDHGGGVTTRYAHLSAIDVVVGDRLDAGERLGAVGSTGASTGPHLHLEVRVDGTPIDPRDVGV